MSYFVQHRRLAQRPAAGEGETAPAFASCQPAMARARRPQTNAMTWRAKHAACRARGALEPRAVYIGVRVRRIIPCVSLQMRPASQPVAVGYQTVATHGELARRRTRGHGLNRGWRARRGGSRSMEPSSAGRGAPAACPSGVRSGRAHARAVPCRRISRASCG